MSKIHAQKVTLSQWEGLSREILARLGGKNGPFWLKSLQRLMRRENPWITFRGLHSRNPTFGSAVNIDNAIRVLEEAGIQVHDNLRNLSEATANDVPPKTEDDIIRFVVVRFGDLASKKEWDESGYDGLVARAQESGFSTCTAAGGLFYARCLYSEQPAARLIVCTTPFELERARRIPYISKRAGKCAGEIIGSFACMYAIEYFDPETLVILESVR